MAFVRQKLYVNEVMTKEDLENSALAISDVAMEALKKHIKEQAPKRGQQIVLEFVFRFR